MPRFVAGLDLGQSHDFSAFTVVEEAGTKPSGPPPLLCRLARRWPLQTAYPQIVSDVVAMMGKPPLENGTLLTDFTGVGRPVLDLLRAARPRCQLVPVTIVGGTGASQQADGWHVSKVALVHSCVVGLQSKRLRFAKGMSEADVLAKELLNFRIKVTTSGNETYSAWHEGANDDLVMSLALCTWWLSRPRPALRLL